MALLGRSDLTGTNVSFNTFAPTACVQCAEYRCWRRPSVGRVAIDSLRTCSVSWYLGTIGSEEGEDAVRIETPRLTLRPWASKDIEQLTLGLNDFKIARWLAFVPHPYKRSDAEAWIARCQRLAAENRPIAYEFAIELKPECLLIGSVSLNKIDWHNRTAGGGIWIADGHQGRGFGQEAFGAKIDFAFRDLGLTSLVNGYFDGNDASWAMQRKLGYRRIAEVPSRCLADGRQTIEHVTRLLREEWEVSQNRSG